MGRLATFCYSQVCPDGREVRRPSARRYRVVQFHRRAPKLSGPMIWIIATNRGIAGSSPVAVCDRTRRSQTGKGTWLKSTHFAPCPDNLLRVCLKTDCPTGTSHAGPEIMSSPRQMVSRGRGDLEPSRYVGLHAFIFPLTVQLNDVNHDCIS